MNASGTRLLCASVALLASACTGTSGSSSAGSGAASGDDGGSPSDTPMACAYMETTVTGCDGNDTSTSDVQCADEPCSGLTLDTAPTSVGDCYGYTEYSGQTDLHLTCAQWQASGGDAGTCAALETASGTACGMCIQTWCASAWCGCAADPHLDDAGSPRCADYIECLGTCIGDGGTANLSGCESRCAPGYTSAERANGAAIVSCLLSHCHTSTTCG